MGSDPSCPYLEDCPMYSQFKHQGTLTVFRINYCDGTFACCERYRCRQRGETPRRELMPNGAVLRFAVQS
ncbi:MAG: hypothetical protein ABIJ09_26435 [Pseudomonadota bacterium]